MLFYPAGAKARGNRQGDPLRGADTLISEPFLVFLTPA